MSVERGNPAEKPRRFPRVLAFAVALSLVLPGIGRAEPVPVYRVVLESEGGTIRLRDLVPLEKSLPPDEARVAAGGDPVAAPHGWWFELRTPDGPPLYRHTFRDPALAYFEGSTGSSSGEITRVEAVRDHWVVSLLIPRHPGASELVIFAPRTDRPATDASSPAVRDTRRSEDGSSREVARIPISTASPR